MPGALVAERIVEAYALAAVDPYRAATHNKGIMNGIDAVVIATGNDWRAIEAGAHAYAPAMAATAPSPPGRSAQRAIWSAAWSCRWPWARWAARRVSIPLARLALQIMGVTTARALAEIIVVGGAGAKPGRPPRPGHRRHPARPHGPPRPAGRHRRRRHRRRGGSGRGDHGAGARHPRPIGPRSCWQKCTNRPDHLIPDT